MTDDDLDVNLRWPEGEPPGDVDDDGPQPPAAVPVRGGDAPTGGPLLPALAGKVNGVEAQVRTLAVRLDALTASTEALRASLEDRLDTYADLVAASARQRDDALADLDARVRKAAEALARVAALVEVVVDTMPGSAEGSG